MVFLSGMIKCSLYPGLKLFAVSSTKEQISNIAKEKIDELMSLIPGLANEIDYSPGKTIFQRDYVRITLKNKSVFDIVALKESTRGERRHGGIIEEVILIDGQLFNSVILPLMNVSRKLANGLPSDQNSPINKSQNYVTTAGWRNTYAYDKMLQLLMWQVLYKDKALVLGGSWRIPVLEKLLDKSFVNDIKSDETYDEGTFIREYKLICTL